MSRTPASSSPTPTTCASPRWKDRMSMTRHRDPAGRHVPRSRRPRHGAARRRPPRAHRDAEGPPAQVVLRRPRLGAVRRDHAVARVLPDPHRAFDPARPRRRHRRRERGRHPRRARLRHLGEDPDPPRRVPSRRPPAHVRPVRRLRGDPARRRRPGRGRVSRASTSTPSSATSSGTSRTSRPPDTAPSRSSAGRSGTSRPSPGRSSSPRWPRPSGPARRSCSAPTS